MGTIFNIQKFCIHDGDGIRTCVFLKGCPLRCIWCHNPESFDKAPCLSFDKSKCSSCGKCLIVCSAREIENGILKICRDRCISCGKCSDICLNGANEIIGREMTASEVLDEVIKDRMFYEASGGGQQYTVTVVSPEDLIDAKKHPENHRNLIVRVGGYSDYFTNLSDELQDNVIERTFAEM